ncbi:MAG: plastocyanin/azurin family copper-binding protein [Actinobacteria bacterium]|nr:plastocyanin/azurin family copper-binding protein [Actinomycetota bacterium]
MRHTGDRKEAALLALVLAAMALALSACGTSYGNGGSSSTGGAAKTTGHAASVSMTNYAFHPANLTVSRGTTVTWSNGTNIVHTVTADSGAFDSGNVNPGKSFSYTFDQAGTFPYHCTYHVALGMRGTVTVK